MKKLVVLVFGVLLSSACTVVRPGGTAVVFNKLTGNVHQDGTGIYLALPGRDVQEYPVSLRTYSMVQRANEGSSHSDDSIDLPTAEGQHIKLDISVTYNTNEQNVIEVYKNFRGADIEEIEATYIRRTIMTVAQNVAGKMSLTELISTKRELLQSSIETELKLQTAKMGFTVDKVNLGAAHLPQSVEEQMQHKMAAQQEAQRAEYELQKQTTLAKSKVVAAQGEADANKILQQTLTPELLEKMKLEKWDGKLPQVSGSTGQIINLK